MKLAVETAKTGKVTAVVAVMSIFCKKKGNLWSANSWNEKLSCQKAESANFLEENSCGLRNIPLKTRKGRLPKNLVPKSNELELSSTNLMLKSKNHAQIVPKSPIQALAMD
jgi:hypothetical protein